MKIQFGRFLNNTPLDEGYIKYQPIHRDAPALADEFLVEIIRYRQKLYDFSFIGMYETGIGYGNISLRTIENQFVISGSATGGKAKLSADDFCTVTQCDVDANSVYAEGPIAASSESMTHYVLYQCDPKIKAVIHIHSQPMWEQLCGAVPTTGADIPYGTPAMAHEMRRLFEESDVRTQKIIAMAGHPEGIITFGESLEEAFLTLFKSR